MTTEFHNALEMLERSVNGESFRQSAKRFRIGAGAVARRTCWCARILTSPCYADDFPAHDIGSPYARRKYRAFWLEQIEKARARHDEKSKAEIPQARCA